MPRWMALVLPALLAPGLLLAQQGQIPQPRLYALQPAGAKAGTTVEVRLSSGAELDGVERLLFSHPGIKAEAVTVGPDRLFPEARVLGDRYRVTVGADVPPGLYEVRAAGPTGVTNARTFVVGERAETAEIEPNHSPAKPQAVALGTVVNGTTDNQNYDAFQVELKKGQRLLVHGMALRLDSRAQLALELQDGEGRTLARVAGTRTTDPLLDASAPADGAFVLRVHDLTFKGGDEYFYRLTVGAGPWVDVVDPPVVLAGRPTKVVVYGRQLPGGTPAEGIDADGRPLEKLETTISGLDKARAGEIFLFPGEATPDVAGWRLETPQGRSNVVRLHVADAEPLREAEPNDDPAKAQALTLPARVLGRLQERGDLDWYVFTAKKGQTLWIEVLSQRLGWPTDPAIVLQSAESGKDLLETDDPSTGDNNRNSMLRRLRLMPDDPAVAWTAPNDGAYRLQVRDLYGGGQGDPRFFYHLSIREARPDFRLVAFPFQPFAENNRVDPWTCTIRRGGSERVRVYAFRREGFEGPIRIEAHDLPKGVTSRPVIVSPGSASEDVVLQAVGDAPPGAGTFRITGTADVGGKPLERTAISAEILYTVTDANQQPTMPRVTDRIAVAVDAERTVPLGAILGKEKETYRTARGGKLKIPVRLVKQADAKDATKVTLKAEGLPGQGNQRAAQVKDVAVELSKPDAEIEIEVSDKAPVGPLTFYLAGEVQIGYTHDPDRPKRLEEDRKRAEKVGKEAGEEAKSAEAARQKAEAEAKKARQALEEVRKKKTEEGSDAAVKVAEDRLRAAEGAQAKAAEAEAKAKELAKEAADWQKRLADMTKKASDAAKEKKVKLWVASLPLTVEIAAAPISIEAPAQPPVVRAGEKTEVVLKLRREFGFGEEFKIELKAPGAAKLSLADGATVAKGAAEAKLVVAAAKDAAVGVHAVEIKASLKWNGKTIPFEQEISLKVDKPEEKKPEEKKPDEKKDEPKKDAK